MARFGILSLTPLPDSVKREALLASLAVQDGDEVIVVACNGVQPRCTFDMTFDRQGSRLSQCLNCFAATERGHVAVGGMGRLLPMGELLDDGRLAGVYGEIDALAEGAVLDYVFRDMPFGDWVQVALATEYFGERWQRLPGLYDKARGWLKSMVTAALATERFIEVYRPDAILVLNGHIPCERTVGQVAERLGVRRIYYEAGQRPHSFVLREREAACFYRFTEEWATWADAPLTVAETVRLDRYLTERQTSGTYESFVFSPHATGNLDQVRAALGLRPDRPVLVAFTNVLADSALFNTEAAFTSHTEWLLACIAYAIDHPEVDLVVRVHPSEAVVWGARSGRWVPPQDLASDVIHSHWPELPANVKLVPPGSPLSSYDLLALAHAVLVYVSTVGMEAAAFGRPVIGAGRIHYRDAGIVWSVPDKRDFAATIDRVLADRSQPPHARERARRYLYFWMFREAYDIVGLMPEAMLAMGLPPGHPDWHHHARTKRYVRAYLRGKAPFIPPPAPWRPKDEHGPKPLPMPDSPILLGLVDWADPSAFLQTFVPRLADMQPRPVIKLWGAGVAREEALSRLIAGARQLGDPATWPDIDLLMPEETDLTAWLCRAQAVLVAGGAMPEPFATLAAQAGMLVFGADEAEHLPDLLARERDPFTGQPRLPDVILPEDAPQLDSSPRQGGTTGGRGLPQATSPASGRAIVKAANDNDRAGDAARAAPIPLSICVVSSGDGERLAATLASIAPLAADVVIATDGESARPIADSFGARIVHRPGADAVSLRQHALAAAPGRWVLHLHAGETITGGHDELRRLTAIRPQGPDIALVHWRSEMDSRTWLAPRLHARLPLVTGDDGAPGPRAPGPDGAVAALVTAVTLLAPGAAPMAAAAAGHARSLAMLARGLDRDPGDAFRHYQWGVLQVTEAPDEAIAHLRTSLDLAARIGWQADFLADAADRLTALTGCAAVAP